MLVAAGLVLALTRVSKTLRQPGFRQGEDEISASQTLPSTSNQQETTANIFTSRTAQN